MCLGLSQGDKCRQQKGHTGQKNRSQQLSHETPSAGHHPISDSVQKQRLAFLSKLYHSYLKYKNNILRLSKEEAGMEEV